VREQTNEKNETSVHIIITHKSKRKTH
jgi:hypothetical protein